MNIQFFGVLENEIFSYCHYDCNKYFDRGNDYSLFNSDWTLNLKYLTFSLYTNYLTLYILL